MTMTENRLEKSTKPLFVNGELLCVMCKNASIDMWRLICGHIICDKCKITLFQKSGDTICKYKDCNTQINCKTQVFQDKELVRNIEQQMVYCSFKHLGCDAVINWKDMESHMMRCEGICEKCNTLMKRMDMDSHICRMKATEELSENHRDSVLLISDHASQRVSQTDEYHKAIKQNREKTCDACAEIHEHNKQLQGIIEEATGTNSKSISDMNIRLSEIDLRLQILESAKSRRNVEVENQDL
ncbi:uncharacterized protein LOC110465994 [Mizuhopecten yessoensis]|uniref:E3 ubiquitin-protein ligase PDZRN3 n=1 Tax=Mizuhopecten yessoensis TaxID=6573 RepID=A0A210PQ99_MIZYE|nr:uncharacterized protein LOC110465994 [Mizuhopecten yessoensis]XP_021377901.1 uncharacterized protein LOC110465994 [Mizuhopecten yessoensis]OWF38675.1 E3 ubiquitin-protein ligase PDZRN3 [Mizuhopecten yessoensis]